MCRRKAHAIPYLILILTGGPMAAFASLGSHDLPTCQFEVIKTISTPGDQGKAAGKTKPMSVRCRYWIKGANERMEMVAGRGNKVVSLFRDGVQYRWTTAHNRALKSRVKTSQTGLHSVKDWIIHPEHLYHELHLMGIRKTGQQTIDGKACEVYVFRTFKSRSGKKTSPARSKVWIWSEKKFPVKIEKSEVVETARRMPIAVKGKKAKQGLHFRTVKRELPCTVRTEYKRIVIGKPISDRLFQVPENVKVVESGHAHSNFMGR